MNIFGVPDKPPPVEGVFISRPNRFIIIAEIGGRRVRVHCPNPGRIWEVLHPGRKLYLIPSVDPKRKTPYSLAAVLYRGKIIPMNAAQSNRITDELILPVIFPNAGKIKAEYSVPRSPRSITHLNSGLSDSGESTVNQNRTKKVRSRFDFYIEERSKRHIIEVKSCTLTEEGVAMFPDAPTERGRRHLEELMEIQSSGEYECHIILVLLHGDTRLFIPNFHTDPDFAFTLERASEELKIHAVSVETDRFGEVKLCNPNLPIDFTSVDAARKNRGCYMIIFHITEDDIALAADYSWKTGWYILIENAGTDLRDEMNRRIRKKNREGTAVERINYFSSERKGIPIYSLNNLVEEAVEKLAELGVTVQAGRTEHVSDSKSGPPIFYFESNPLRSSDFTEFLFFFRHRKALEGNISVKNLTGF